MVRWAIFVISVAALIAAPAAQADEFARPVGAASAGPRIVSVAVNGGTLSKRRVMSFNATDDGPTLTKRSDSAECTESPTQAQAELAVEIAMETSCSTPSPSPLPETSSGMLPDPASSPSPSPSTLFATAPDPAAETPCPTSSPASSTGTSATAAASVPSSNTDGACSASSPCPDPTDCCSEFGFCGKTADFCNASSITPARSGSSGSQPSPETPCETAMPQDSMPMDEKPMDMMPGDKKHKDKKKKNKMPKNSMPSGSSTMPSSPGSQDGACSATSPCPDPTDCCSEFGFCGKTQDFCNARSMMPARQPSTGGAMPGEPIPSPSPACATNTPTPTAATATAGSQDGVCSAASPCPDPTDCCSEFGFCGKTQDFCNARSIAPARKPSTSGAMPGVPSPSPSPACATNTPAATTGGSQDGQCSATSPCPDPTDCCSEFGFCGKTTDFCNARSIAPARQPSSSGAIPGEPSPSPCGTSLPTPLPATSCGRSMADCEDFDDCDAMPECSSTQPAGATSMPSVDTMPMPPTDTMPSSSGKGMREEQIMRRKRIREAEVMRTREEEGEETVTMSRPAMGSHKKMKKHHDDAGMSEPAGEMM